MSDPIGPTDFTVYEDIILKEGHELAEVMPMFGIRIVMYVDPEGKNIVDWIWDSDNVTAYQAIGALESAKLSMWEHHLESLEDNE